MLPHPQLWPAILGASVGLPLIVWACVWYVRRWPGFTPRQRWLYGVAIVLAEAAFWLSIYACFIEPRQLVVREVEIVSEHWHGPPLTIGMVSDTHVGGPHVSAGRVENIVTRLNALEPDLVVLLGDYVNGHAPAQQRSAPENEEIVRGLTAFVRLNAPLGVVAVLGNHDGWYSHARVTAALQQAGVAVLWNRHVVINHAGVDFVVGGLGDDDTGDSSFPLALDGAPATDTIVLVHNPDDFAEMPEGPALMLAGHGHCGQVTIPLIGRPVTPLRNPRWVCHRTDKNGQTLYVTAGIGTSILPLRFLNPPEIVVIKLRGARAPQATPIAT